MSANESFPNSQMLVRGDLLADEDREGPSATVPAVDRVCWIDFDLEVIGLFEVTNDKAFPRIEDLSNVEADLRQGIRRVLNEDGWAPPVIFGAGEVKSGDSSPEYIRANERYEKIKSLVENHERDLFLPSKRGPLIANLVATGAITKPTAYSLIRLYFKRNMVVAALVTEHGNCGGLGRVREPGDTKRGAPYKRKNRPEKNSGINCDKSIRRFLKQGWKKFKKQNVSIAKAFKLTIDRYFSTGYKVELGMAVPILPPIDQLPTVGQFRYWGTHELNTRKEAAEARGERKKNLKHRETLGSAREGVLGPGDQYQIDATGGLIHLVARADVSLRIGKAIVYGVSDTYSSFVAGWVTVLENASYIVSALALERAFTDKVEICRELGIEIEPDDWPADIVCTWLATDRGPELIGRQSDKASEALGYDYSNTPPGRPDWKPYIEGQFGHLKNEIDDIPGATKGPQERGEHNGSQDACLMLDETDKLNALSFLKFNHSHIIEDHPDAVYLIAEGLEVTPINLWNWGRRNRSGGGRRFAREYVRAALLPKADVPATSDGLMFKDLGYFSPTLSQGGHFLRSTGHKRKRFTIAYDPRDLSEVWLLDSQGKFVEACPLTSKYSHYRGISLWELEEQRAAAAPVKMSAKQREMELGIGFEKEKQKTINSAKQRQADLGIVTVEYSEEARQKEKAERRSETAWTNNQEKVIKPKDPIPGYVSAPDYAWELEELGED